MRDMIIPDAVHALDRELRGIFGARLQSLSIYGGRTDAGAQAHAASAAHGHDGPPTQTLAVVDSLTQDDLRGCARHVEAWHDAGLATPLLIAERELERSLDAFPLELGAILADHVVVSGGLPRARAERHRASDRAHARG